MQWGKKREKDRTGETKDSTNKGEQFFLMFFELAYVHSLEVCARNVLGLFYKLCYQHHCPAVFMEPRPNIIMQSHIYHNYLDGDMLGTAIETSLFQGL